MSGVASTIRDLKKDVRHSVDLSRYRELILSGRQQMHGFSLLEVMVALALLALSFTSLVLVQGRATRLAVEAHNISIATELARYQLMECKREVQKIIPSVSDFNSEGDFSDQGFADFKWECHAPKFNMKTPSASKIEENVKAQKSEVTKKKDVGATSTVSAPFISMITDTLANSVRELAVIIRFTNNNVADEVRVVTHVIDLAAMSALSRVLREGAKTFEESFSKKKPESNKPEDKKVEGAFPPSSQRPRGPQ